MTNYQLAQQLLEYAELEVVITVPETKNDAELVEGMTLLSNGFENDKQVLLLFGKSKTLNSSTF
jgi:hypothetical protein